MPAKSQPKIPILRFPEFDNAPAWEEKKLGEVCDINPNIPNLPDKFIYVDLESVVSGKLILKKDILKYEAPSRAQRLLKNGDVIYQTVRPYQRNNLFCNFFDGNEYVASTGYAQLRAFNSSKFLFQIIHTDIFVNQVLSKSTGSNYPAINSKDLAKINIAVPQLAEQQKIADCLSSLDGVIALEGQKLVALKDHKKGLMQNLFPSLDCSILDCSILDCPQDGNPQEGNPQEGKGKAIPNFRFPEFNNAPAWEIKKLGEVAEISTGSSNRENSTEEGKYTFFDRSSDKRASSKFLFNSEAIIVAGEGRDFIPRYFSGKFDLHQRAYAIMTFNKCIGKYIYFWIFRYRSYFLKYSVGSTMPSLRMESFTKFPIFIPSLAEQQKIADCLSSLDGLITAQAQKIISLKDHKKGLMQKMFV